LTPRLVLTGPLTGAENMALDEWLLQHVHETGPVLRVYTWSPPAVSLGYGQRSSGVDRDAIARLGFDLTRRLTGGRAVLHQHELTYSVVVEAGRLNVGRSVSKAYAMLSGCLIDSLSRLGIESYCRPAHGPRSEDPDPACFAATIGGDLAVDDRKLVGSAQCHKFGGILQHGSLPLRIDDEALTACLHRPASARRDWTCLEELGVEVTSEALAEAMVEGFTELLGGRAEIGMPTDAEWAGLRELAAKYGSDEWTLRL